MGNIIFGTIMGAICFMILVFGIILLNGKGAFLIAGFNTIRKEDREKYDKKALCRFVGKLMIGIFFCMLAIFSGAYFGISWLSIGGTILILTAVPGAVFYANTGNRFLKPGEIKTPPARRNIILTAIFLVIVLIGVSGLFYVGEKEPVVSIQENGLQIDAMYGLTVDFSEIANVTLVEKSMRDIGVGMRTNGYGGFGGALKGNFRSDKTGKTLLFVKSNSSPTLRIERNGTKDIYISFKSGEKTEILYRELEAVLQ